MPAKRIILGYPLDLLLDRTCKYSTYEEVICSKSLRPDVEELKAKKEKNEAEEKKLKDIIFKENLGGITLPFEGDPGTGNIIIRGKPGTAKSTLALQIACTAAQKGNNISSFYITIEESPKNIIKKCEHFGWAKFIEELDQVKNLGFGKKSVIESNYSHINDYSLEKNTLSSNNIIRLFNNGKDANSIIIPKVLVSTFTPRNIFSKDENSVNLFETRYKQLENILISASYYNREVCAEGNNPPIGFISIDSLNVFGDSLLTRTQLFRLFDLFKKYRILGIFIVEEDEKSIYAQENQLHSETIEYIADMVISLTIGEDEGYSLRYFEITKSRYQHQVYGKHPFKIIEPNTNKDFTQIAIKVYPSLHYIVYGTDISEKGSNNNSSLRDTVEKEVFCDPNANFFLSKEHKKSSSLLIEGPRDSFKTSLARDFLLRGLFDDGDANVLFIRFLDYFSEGSKLKSFRISDTCKSFIYYDPTENELNLTNNELDGKFVNKFNAFIEDGGILSPFWKLGKKESYWAGFKLDGFADITTKRFLCSYVSQIGDVKKRYTELIFQTGYILPEEFMQIMLETILKFGSDKKPIRIVIDEIGRIGSSMPLLYQSKTAGALFLTAVNHIVRNYDIKLLITGTTGEYNRSDEIINKTKTLVDDVLSTKKINVFGDNYVTIKGGTLTSSEPGIEQMHSDENVPGVIIPTETYTFKVDRDKFIGLVGFDTENIYRPGIYVYLYEENEIQSDYNKELGDMLNFSFAEDISKFRIDDLKTVEVKPYNRTNTTAFHDSIGFLKGNPIERTVVCAFDEFFASDPEKIKNALIPINERDKEVKELYSEEQWGKIKENFHKAFVSKTDGKTKSNELNVCHYLPYYDNVLILAANIELANKVGLDLEKTNLTTWEDIVSIAKGIDYNDKVDYQIIDFITRSPETCSCILLDGLSSVYPEYELKDLFNKIISDINLDNIKHLIVVLKSICDLAHLTQKTLIWRDFTEYEANLYKKEKKSFFDKSKSLGKNPKLLYKEEKYQESLSNNSIFYVCWYSELRNLISFNTDLVDKLVFFPLPGKGFKGDWQLGVMKGSVSSSLGHSILKILCSEQEDFKRFVRGVGLPTSIRFAGQNINSANFFSWPGSDINETKNRLSELFKIHDKAKKRSDITNYNNIRIILSTLFQELITLNDEQRIKGIIIERLPGILQRVNAFRKSTKG